MARWNPSGQPADYAVNPAERREPSERRPENSPGRRELAAMEVTICLRRDEHGVRCDRPVEDHYTKEGKLRQRGPLSHEPEYVKPSLGRHARRKLMKGGRVRPAPKKHWLKQIQEERREEHAREAQERSGADRGGEHESGTD